MTSFTCLRISKESVVFDWRDFETLIDFNHRLTMFDKNVVAGNRTV